MDVPPRDRRKQGIIDGLLLFRGYVFLGLLNAAAVLAAYFPILFQGGWRFGQSLEFTETAFVNPIHIKAATMVFAGIVIMQIANVFSCRSERLSAFRIGVWSNRLIIIGIAFELAFTAMFIYVPDSPVRIHHLWPRVAGLAASLRIHGHDLSPRGAAKKSSRRDGRPRKTGV